MNANVIKSQKPFVTTKELKKTPATPDNRKMAEFLDSHEFSFSIDIVSKNPHVEKIPKV